MTGEIRAVVHVEAPGDGHPGHLRAVGRPSPSPGAGEVVVAVHAALLAPGAAPPLVDGTVVGGEAAGVVAALGPGVAQLAVGDSVVLPVLLTCGVCPPCRGGRDNLCRDARRPGVDVDGWLAEQVVVSAHRLISRPATVPAPLAASVTGVVATAYHALHRAGAGPGLSVAVVGADALGLHLVQLGALSGAEVTVLDDRADARARAEDLGADHALPLSSGPPIDVLGQPVDRVLVTPDHPVDASAAVGALAPGGRLVLVDAPSAEIASLPLEQLVRDELDVVGAHGGTLMDAVELFDLAAEGRLILHTAIGRRATIADLVDVETALSGATDGLRIAVDPRPDPPAGA